MKKYIIILSLTVISVLISNRTVSSQGCVAVRPMGCSASGRANSVGILTSGEWQISSSYRYFRSFRHFRGEYEEAHRVEQGTEVINITHATDLGIARGLNDQIGLALNLPLIYYDRSSLYEHYGNSITANPTQARFDTGARGIGDMRLTANYWVFNPETAAKGNMAFGLGIKLPTGNSDIEDTFHRRSVNGSDSLITRPVDQSIQLGDGGWGINVETQGFRSLFKNGALYFNGFYLLNPRGENSVGHSVADQYAARLGLNYTVLPKTGISAGLGGRLEGVPSEDLIGNNDGRRRPGYIISVEPSVSYLRGSMNLTLNVPFALYRNRTQSVSDEQRTAETGVYTIGDAAFADYLINFNVSYNFGQKHPQMNVPTKISIPGSLQQNDD
jgi:hypothetical protein